MFQVSWADIVLWGLVLFLLFFVLFQRIFQRRRDRKKDEIIRKLKEQFDAFSKRIATDVIEMDSFRNILEEIVSAKVEQRSKERDKFFAEAISQIFSDSISQILAEAKDFLNTFPRDKLTRNCAEKARKVLKLGDSETTQEQETKE